MTAPDMTWREGLLALADGSVFEGEVLGFDAAEGGLRPPPPARSCSTRS